MTAVGFFSRSQLDAMHRRPLSLVPRCGACGLYKQCQSPKMEVDGDGRKKILILGEAPGPDEDKRGRPFVGVAGQRLIETLDEIGIDFRRDCWITNAIACYPGRKGNVIATPTDQQVSHCRPKVVGVVKRLQPNVIIPLGGTAINSLMGWLWRGESASAGEGGEEKGKKKTGGVQRWVGWQIPCQAINSWVVSSYHPSFCNRVKDPVVDMFFKRHLEAATAQENRPWEEVPDYRQQVRVVMDPNEAGDRVRELTRSGKLLVFDLETDRLKPDHPDARIVTCSVSDGEVSVAYPWQGAAITATKDMARSKSPKAGWNIVFETRYCARLLGIVPKRWVYDGMTGTHVLDNRSGITSVKFQGFVRLGAPSWDDHIKPYLKAKKGGNNKNRIDEVDLRLLLLYNGLDSLIEHKVCVIQMAELGIAL